MTDRDPRIPFGLAYFMAFKPKSELSSHRIEELRAADVDFDAIPDDAYVPMNDEEYDRAPANSEPATKRIAILMDAWDTLRDNKYVGYVDEPADGFITPDGVFYAEFS